MYIYLVLFIKSLCCYFFSTETLPNTLQTLCEKCSETQVNKVLSVLKRVKNDYPAEWNVVLQKWDPNGEYRTKFEAKFGKRLEIWESWIILWCQMEILIFLRKFDGKFWKFPGIWNSSMLKKDNLSMQMYNLRGEKTNL